MSSRCTCCHICHTSLKTSRRSFHPCTSCPSIICRQCIEGMGDDWDTTTNTRNWECPRCRDCCPCKRCKGKESSENKRRSSPPTLVKRKNIEVTPPEPKRRKISTDDGSPSLPKFLASLSQVQIPEPQTTNSLVSRLEEQNRECLSYIDRTEKLLQIIREEQARISSEIETLVTQKKLTIPNQSSSISV